MAWGLGNFVVIMISQELEPFYRKFHERFTVKDKFYWRAFQVLRTIFIMSSLRAFDCYRNVPLTFKMYFSMFTKFNWDEVFSPEILKLGMSVIDYAVVLVGFVMLLSVSLIQRSGSVREKIAAKPYWVRFVVWFGLFVLVLLWGNYGIGYDASQFIYNQF